ncbi:hypothetical protein yc1106_03275 [Curvularia clavata]|uniref:RRM domain-containing protein n=1 Tax=Curvularia clavata TaxID=95742 RepID=A0A9Q8Z4A6_CURCL|nr:hypothetical protein yc1106_03275 [Curvularia clavata]
MADKMEGVVPGSSLIDPGKYPVPIETIYVNNLEERVKIDTLREALTRVFKHYGPILDIIAKSSLKRKGQAFVVFDSEKASLEAVEEMDGFEMYGKAMKVRRAKTHSDETVKRKAPDMFEDHKRKRLMLKDFKRAEEDAKAAANPVAAEKPRAAKTGAAAIPDEYVRPNKTLFLQNIPRDVTEETLTEIFERYEGFKEVRLVSVRSVAFAEFENEQFAITAKEGAVNIRIGAENKLMKVTYQRQANEAKQKWYDKIAWTPDACEAYWQVMGYLQSQRGYLVDVRQVELEKFREQGRLYKRMYECSEDDILIVLIGEHVLGLDNLLRGLLLLCFFLLCDPCSLFICSIILLLLGDFLQAVELFSVQLVELGVDVLDGVFGSGDNDVLTGRD